MKKVGNWYWPDGELHMIEWMANPKNHVVLNGRESYQGRKQSKAWDLCGPNGRRMIDVGAHVGLWSYNFAQVFEHVEAFEPVEAHRECFLKNVTAENVTLYKCALGAEAGAVSMSVNPISSGDSWVKGSGEIVMKTIDSFGFDGVDFIKVDCEGYEEFVLRGALETLFLYKPVICVEQKRDMAVKFGLKPMGAVQWLINAGIGYKVVAEMNGDYFLEVEGRNRG